MRKTAALFCGLFAIVGLFHQPAFAQGSGPAGYTYCASEGGSYTLTVKSHVAYGADGHFNYLYNQIGKITFDNGTFGDPAAGVVKSGYYKIADGSESTVNLAAALTKIKNHLTGSAILTASQLNAQAQILQDNIFLIGNTDAIILQALDIVSYYEANKAPIFINATTKGGFPNSPGALDGFELVRAVFKIQQGLHDEAFTSENLAKYPTLLEGKKFGSADFFPGVCPVPSDPSASYTVKVQGSMPKAWGRPTAFSSTGSRKATGYYLAPGTIGTVTVPAAMVNKGFKVLVGAHTWDKTGNNPVRRFFRVAKNYLITSTVTRIANPFGGGIYIVTPYEADLGIVDIQLTNVVAAPFFSAQSFNQTTLQEWLGIQRHHVAPWADFQSDKFMMQVPTRWIYNYADPVTLMQDWDKRMDGVSELLGYPLIRNNVILYVQVDLDIMYGVYGIGYPQVNNTFDPAATENGNSGHWFLQPGDNFWETEFHELGHAQVQSDFPGETEAIVNVLAAIVWNKKFGMDIDLAFGNSFDNKPWISRDQAALNWMVTPNFRAGNPMDISNTTKDEVRYQQRGYAKYIEIAALFGWGVMERFYTQENLDFIANTPGDGLDGTDSRILRLSKSAGVDLRPLIHFWGVQPVDDNGLKNLISSAGLKPSALIYDRLVHYKSIIPMSNTAFRTHAGVFLNKNPQDITAGESPDYGEGWYFVWLPQYAQTHGTAAQAALQSILDLYFPGGRPPGDMAPVITTQPQSITVSAGQTATFSVTATSTTAQTFQWKKNGSAINGATSASYTTSATIAADSGAIFTVVVTNAAGSVTSNEATLTVHSSRSLDLNGDGAVDVLDLAILASAFGTINTTADLDSSGGVVNDADITLWMAGF